MIGMPTGTVILWDFANAVKTKPFVTELVSASMIVVEARITQQYEISNAELLTF
jgi:hypothetical protein